MRELQTGRATSWLLIPIYINPQLANFDSLLAEFQHFLTAAKDTTGLKLAVVDDGCGISQEKLKNFPDLFVQFPENRGKAFAIREGLKVLLAQKDRPGFIVQYDGDGDQLPDDIPGIHRKLLEVSENNPEIPTLVIGDRYSEGLRTRPNPESVAYRQTLLIFFGAIASQLGADGVRDWVSGARGYTASYSKGFVERSRSSRYGVESEQLIVASLLDAKVATAPLSDSRPRDPWTLTSKWLQNFEIYREHAEALRNKDTGHVVDFVGELVGQLRSSGEAFELDLAPLGLRTKMRFSRWGKDAHTAEIPSWYRSRFFVDDAEFPFTLKAS